MRMTRLALKTQREAPADAEAVSHQLLVRAGYIRRMASGVYSFLPLGLRVLTKLNQIVREEFDAAGAQELLLPALHPVEIWEQTGRLATMADVLMTVDAKGGTFVLGPTHEEAVIATVSPDLESYRDLPVTVYQIQTKFRDEARPRYGLMRTREFIMADAYSFDVSQEGMKESYNSMYQAFVKIFDRCGLPYVPVEADSGAIGGDVNHEFMVPSAIGEDHFAQCVECGYAANIEAAKRGGSRQPADTSGIAAMEIHATPGASSVRDVVSFLGAKGLDIVDAALMKSLAFKDANGDVVMILVPGNREVRVPAGLIPLTDADFESNSFLFKGFIGPMGMRDQGVRLLADYSITERSSWFAGANLEGHHVSNAVLDRDFTVDEIGSFVVVADGDPCPNCGRALSLVRSAEAGHTFQLGLAYSSKIPYATFKAEDGSDQKYWMGCYGIGMSRLPAAIAENFHDENGLRWPRSVAPYQVEILTITPGRAPELVAFADSVYEELSSRGVEVLYDDRDVAAGVKFADADLIGVPVIVTIGQRGLANGVIEVKDRLSGERSEVGVPDLIEHLLALQ